MIPQRFTDASSQDAELDVSTHLTVESLTSHAEATSSSLNYLLLSLLSLHSSDTLAHAASHLGVSQTISTLLRALPYHAANGRMIVPAELTAKHGVNQEQIFRNLENVDKTGQKNLEDAVFEFATVANDHLLTARDMFREFDGKVPGRAMPLFSSAVRTVVRLRVISVRSHVRQQIPVVSYLQRLEVANFNPFDPVLQTKDWKLPWRVWSSYYRSRF